VKFAVIEEMLDAYYAARGWDTNGIPTRETLEKFNLAGH
jgi:aldehyde:ferredoxin oxidoreductase